MGTPRRGRSHPIDAEAAARASTAARLQLFDQLAVAGPPITPLDVRVGWMLLGYYNLSKGYAWPSAATLADAIHANERSVRRAIKRLTSEGWFEILPGSGKGNTFRTVPCFGRANSEPRTICPDSESESELPVDNRGRSGQYVRPDRAMSPGTPDIMSDDSPLVDSSNKLPLGGGGLAPSALEGAAPPASTPGKALSTVWAELDVFLRHELGNTYFDIADQLRKRWEDYAGEFAAAEDPRQYKLRLLAVLKGGAASAEVTEDDKGGEETAGQRAVAGK